MQKPLLDPGPEFRSDIAACRGLLRQGSRTFFMASLLLPRAVRDPATALYAFCRLADDAVDLGENHAAALVEFRDRLALAYAGRPKDSPPDRALAEVVARFAVPRALPEALLEGIEWDAQGRRYEDISDLYAYAARVAGTVGAMMALLMGARRPTLVARACDLGVAMQLSNIARDVGEDARAGRLYLPLRWLREAGIDPEAWLADPVFSDQLGSVVKRLLDVADRLYARAGHGIGRLPLACQPSIYAARYLYATIGHEVERSGLDSVSRRAVVPAQRKAHMLARALAVTAMPKRPRYAMPLKEVRFLVDAVTASSDPLAAGAAPDPAWISWWKFGDQVGWAVDLFMRLEQREQPERL